MPDPRFQRFGRVSASVIVLVPGVIWLLLGVAERPGLRGHAELNDCFYPIMDV